MPLTQKTAHRKDLTTLEHHHFAFIADVIKNLTDTYDNPLTRADVIEAFTNACARSNPKFDRERFLRACEAGR